MVKARVKELSKEAVDYLAKCFNYAVKQNKGNKTEMEKAIKNIPDHVFNMHENCDTWCKYKPSPETYTHKIIGDGFEDPELYSELKELFNDLGDSCDQFVACASSQSNECVNARAARKCPKSKCYSTSASGNYRFAFTVCETNLGHTYLSVFLRKVRHGSWRKYDALLRLGPEKR